MSRHIRVLHVDDDPFRELAGRHLEREGLDVVPADCASAGLEALDGSIDCVVSDYEMPTTDGLELLEAVRERDAELPFVLFTGKGSEEIASEAISAGVTDYLQKDASPEQFELLANRIERAVTERRTESALRESERTLSTPVSNLPGIVDADDDPDARIRHLHDATRELVAATDAERIAELTVRAASEVLGLPIAVVRFARGDDLEVIATTQGTVERLGERPPLPIDDSIAGAAFTSGERRVEQDLGETDEPTDAGSLGSATFLPLGDHGVFVVACSEPRAFDEQDIQLATILAASAEASLDRATKEAALRQERDDLAALLDNIPDPTVEAAMTDGEPIVRRVNPAFENVFGYASEDVVGENLDDFILPPEYESEGHEANQQIQAGEEFHGEVRRLAADGPRDFILRVVPHDPGATVTRGYAIYTDITEQKQRERELARQNERIESLHEVATRMKATTDRAEIYEIVIDAAEEILEFDICIVDELEGDVLVPKAVGSDMSLEDYYDETPIHWGDNVGAETARTGETIVVDDLHEGGYVPANFDFTSALSVPLDDWGVFQAVAEEEAAFTPADRQLTELLIEHAVAAIDRKDKERELHERAAKLERQNERLDQFASVVSHDLRNPLSVAKGRLDLARETGDDVHFEHVEEAHDRIAELVDGLLALARRGELAGDPVPVDLGELSEAAWETVDTGGLSLSLTFGEPPEIVADPKRLRQALENLFRNSVEHAEASVVTVGALDDDQGFYVADDGAGIPTDEREAVLESGYSQENGTGFGLAIVDTIAEAHCWTLAVTGGEEGGARFEFRDESTRRD